MMRYGYDEFDERQFKIRGEVYKHGWIFTVALLLVNFFVTDFLGYEWARAPHMFFLCALVSIGFFAVEAIVRDVFTGRQAWRAEVIPAIELIAAGSMFVAAFRKYFGGGVLFAEGGMLTRNGVALATAAVFAAVGIVALAKLARGRREARGQE